MLVDLIAFLVFGLIVGALARLAVPGPNPMGCGMTALVGCAGSLLGGVVARLLFNRPAGLILSILGATLLVWLIGRSQDRTV